MRAVVLFPADTLPAIPMMYGTGGTGLPRNRPVTVERRRDALMYRLRSRHNGK
jgi:hypothetical protein